MYDGLNIRWRETAPDRGLLSLALDELSRLHQQWPETVQCDIVIERTGPRKERFQAHINLGFGKSARLQEKRLQAAALATDAPRALVRAFEMLRDNMGGAPQVAA